MCIDVHLSFDKIKKKGEVLSYAIRIRMRVGVPEGGGAWFLPSPISIRCLCEEAVEAYMNYNIWTCLDIGMMRGNARLQCIRSTMVLVVVVASLVLFPPLPLRKQRSTRRCCPSTLLYFSISLFA